jgi:hypothetical protein
MSEMTRRYESNTGPVNTSAVTGTTAGSHSSAPSTGDDLKQRWWDWHKKNPHVWKLFEKFTLMAISKGHRNLSAWLVVNRIRWETSIETQGDDFKISNDFIALYARYFMHKYPQYNGFFRTKQMKRADLPGNSDSED